MIRSGMDVYWKKRNYAGDVVSVIFTRTTSDPQIIEKSAGGTVACCTLAVNHLARVEDLCLLDPGPPEVQKSRKEPQAKPVEKKPQAPPQKAERALLPNDPSGPPQQSQKATQQNQRPAVPAATPAEPIEPCDVLAVDFLNLLVRAYHVGQKTEVHAVRSMFQTVANCIRRLQPKAVVFALDGGHASRTALLPDYKAHRPEPEDLLRIQKLLGEGAIRVCGFQGMRVVDWEADDVLATLATKYSNTVIVSGDKDLLAMPYLSPGCRIYHPWGDGEFMNSEKKLNIPSCQVTDYLAMCGDTVDGISGIVGCGPKTAINLLKEYQTLEAIIVAATLGKIKGEIGKKIAKQAQSAMVCRQAVELNQRLPLPPLENFAPRFNWQRELQQMKLGSVAAIMDSLEKQRFRIYEVSEIKPQTEVEQKRNTTSEGDLSAATAKAEQVESSQGRELSELAPNAEAVTSAGCESKAAITSEEPKVPEAADFPCSTCTTRNDETPLSGQAAIYATSGFSELKESKPLAGMQPKYFATWTDGSKWLLDPNTKRHMCLSDSPVTEWRIDKRGPVCPFTNAVRKPK